MNELKDARIKITIETWAALKTEAQITGHEQGEIIRQILHEWALRKIRAANLLKATLESEGLSGNETERSG